MKINGYKIMTGLIMSLGFVGKTKQQVDSYVKFADLAAGVALYNYHPYVAVAAKATDYAEPAANVLTTMTNNVWQFNVLCDQIDSGTGNLL
jgi:hypothetical protein